MEISGMYLYGTYPDQNDARELADRIRESGDECLVKGPAPGLPGWRVYVQEGGQTESHQFGEEGDGLDHFGRTRQERLENALGYDRGHIGLCPLMGILTVAAALWLAWPHVAAMVAAALQVAR